MPDIVEQWGFYKASLTAVVTGNPFLDTTYVKVEVELSQHKKYQAAIRETLTGIDGEGRHTTYHNKRRLLMMLAATTQRYFI